MSGIEQTATPDTSWSPKWQERFAFFDQHGGPQSPGFEAALEALPGNKQGMIRLNLIAFFFGPIYLLVLGMWRKALGMWAIGFVIAVILTGIEFALGLRDLFGLQLCIGMINAVLYAKSVNYGCYLTRIKGSKSWNPYEGMRCSL